MVENTPRDAVIDESGSDDQAYMVLDRFSEDAGVNFKLILQSDAQQMYATVAIAFSFVVTSDEGGFAFPSDWLDFPIFDKHGNTLMWSQNEGGDSLLTVTLKEGQSELDVTFADFHDIDDTPFFDHNQALNLRLVSMDGLDANGDPLDGPLVGLDTRIFTGDPDVPYLSADGNEQLAVAVSDQAANAGADTYYGGILVGSDNDSFDWDHHALSALGVTDAATDFQNNAPLRFDEVFGDSAEGYAALDGLLGNSESHVENTLSIADAAATLTASHKHGETADTRNPSDIAAQLGENQDGQAGAHMLQEMIKISGTG